VIRISIASAAFEAIRRRGGPEIAKR
jgi:hypothetical protein